jgi:hypothetical protein
MNGNIAQPMTPEELRRKTTIRLWPDAGLLFGLSKGSTYLAAAAGEIPTLRFGTRYVVPVAKILDLLGEPPNPMPLEPPQSPTL